MRKLLIAAIAAMAILGWATQSTAQFYGYGYTYDYGYTPYPYYDYSYGYSFGSPVPFGGVATVNPLVSPGYSYYFYYPRSGVAPYHPRWYNPHRATPFRRYPW